MVRIITNADSSFKSFSSFVMNGLSCICNQNDNTQSKMQKKALFCGITSSDPTFPNEIIIIRKHFLKRKRNSLRINFKENINMFKFTNKKSSMYNHVRETQFLQ